MASRHKHALKQSPDIVPQPFACAEEAWFWFIASQEALADGGRFRVGLGLVPRPCEPVDILKVVDQLYRNRRLLRDHLLVLRHYGRRRMPPDDRRVKERRAHALWAEAFMRIETVLQRKGIVQGIFNNRQEQASWSDHSLMHAGMAAE